MASPFDDWKLEDVRDAIDLAITERLGDDGAFDTNAAFVEDHDHWQDGKTWVGPNGGADPAVRSSVLAAVERQFTPRDAIGEILDRMANALLKREPDVDFIPLAPIEDPEIPEGTSQEESDRIRAEVEKQRQTQQDVAAEKKRQVSAWWDAKKLWQLARQAAVRSRWSGRGGLRTWIAPGNLQAGAPASSESTDGGAGDEATKKAAPSAGRLPTGLDFLEALMLVELSAPRPDVVRVHTDQETQQKGALFTYRDEDAEEDKAEVWFVDGDKTALQVVGDGGSEVEKFKVDLGGRLPIAEMEAEVLITEPVRRQQNRLNFEESILVRVGEVAGFPERYTLNAEPSGIWLETPPVGTAVLQTEEHGGKTYYLHQAPRTLGAAITTDLVGMITKTGQDEQRAMPGVVFKEPTDPEYAIKACQHAYFTILRQCKQGHLANTATAEASGVAYEQARADYDADLEAVRAPLEGMIREIIEVAIAWGEAMSSKAEGSFLSRYRVSVTLNVNAGPITPDHQNQLNANVKAGTLSRSSAMAAAGIEDVDAEFQKILADPAALVELRTAQAAAITSLRAEGMGWERAARFIGIDDPDLLREFREMDDEAAEEAERIRRQQEEGGEGDDDDITRALKGTGAARQPAAAGAGS